MIKQRVVLRFPKETIEEPVTYRLIKNYNLIINILSAKVNPNEEGMLIIDISGEKEDFDNGMEYLKRLNVEIQPLAKDVIWDEDKCVHCTACIPLCPSHALDMVNRDDMKITFDSDKCIACGICLEVCPYQAMNMCF